MIIVSGVVIIIVDHRDPMRAVAILDWNCALLPKSLKMRPVSWKLI